MDDKSNFLKVLRIQTSIKAVISCRDKKPYKVLFVSQNFEEPRFLNPPVNSLILAQYIDPPTDRYRSLIQVFNISV